MGLPIIEQQATPQAPPHDAEKEQVVRNLAGVRRKIGIHSGKGGVGKTFVAVNLALALARAKKRVGILDADIDCPNVAKFLNLRPLGLEGTPEGRFSPMDHRGLRIVSTHFLTDDPSLPMIVRGPIKHKVLAELLTQADWGELDALILDLPPGTADVPMSSMLLGSLDGLVIVTTPQKESLMDARKSALMAKELGVPVLGIVENMSGDIFGQDRGKGLADELGVPWLGSIPLLKEIRQRTEAGNPSFMLYKETSDALMGAALGAPHKEDARSFWSALLGR